jgi:hypothetical protein
LYQGFGTLVNTEKMNWVNSSLQLAGNLLESVDQQAALTLSGSPLFLIFSYCIFFSDIYYISRS